MKAPSCSDRPTYHVTVVRLGTISFGEVSGSAKLKGVPSLATSVHPERRAAYTSDSGTYGSTVRRSYP